MAWLETIVNGLLVGSLYALFGLGAALTFGVAKIVNVAHGEFIVLSGFIGIMLVGIIPIHPLLLVPLVIVIVFAIGFILQMTLLNRVVGKDPIPPMLLTFGLSIVLKNAMVEVFGATPRSINMGGLRFKGMEVFGMTLGVLPVIIFVISVSLFVALHFFLKYTRVGRTLRATGDEAQFVQLFGVNYRRAFGVATALALSMSAAAGMMLAMRSTITPFTGGDRLLIAFEVVIIGGLGSMWGALIGGLILGVTHLVGLRIDPNSGLLYPDIVFFIILTIMPRGISGWRQ
ncbi:branched-chain amino acid transport system permease protein [Kaistia soli DSM 19436]|uniref:Branched-chain amino acid transport system permease protein n=1 Tax=Kaistia soli DSM 19436 TaxID=1122133 RepID=A0A1M5KJS4_9HYPH|nr:branched-chain amino acid ABC transporter permease [Kaistia soli]SHG52423.1 branched-chain amino acid transport system permease protein [Kaistia soli DSM 19436]